MITTPAQLLELIARAKSAEAIALDTEFFWERTYYPRLGLIQLAVSGDECHLIDPLALADLRPLGGLLADRGLVKILHDAGQDLAILYRATGVAAVNVFDTRLAAGFAGLPATLSLASLVHELLGIDLTKNETRSDWLHRPLSAEQLAYAAADVRHLHALRLALLSRITGPHVKAWVDEELALYNDWHCYISHGSSRYQRMRMAANLPPAGIAVLKRLFDWREETARASDKPRAHIIPDASLLAIAHQPPENMAALRQLGLSSQAMSRYGEAIISLCAASGVPVEAETAAEKPWRLSAKEKAIYQRLQDMIRWKSDSFGIDAGLVGNSDELRAVARFLADGTGQTANLRQLAGWRQIFLEDFLHDHN